MLVARQADDVAFLPKSAYIWGDDDWHPWPVEDSLLWYVFDDRQMYRPGEEVHLKGWIRNFGRNRITSYNVCYTKLLRLLCA